MNKQNEKQIMRHENTQKNKPKCDSTSGKADRRMSQVSQPPLFQTYYLPGDLVTSWRKTGVREKILLPYPIRQAARSSKCAVAVSES